MLSHLSLSVCLMTVSVQPPMPEVGSGIVQSPAPVAASAQYGTGNYSTGNYGAGYGSGGFAPPHAGGTSQGDYCAQCGHRHHKHSPFHDWTCPPCNLSQRYPYYPTDHGNYYFRPYHMQRVVEHQSLAVSWGEDPRNPHGQLVFERVYDQIRAEQAAKSEALPMPMPMSPEVNPPEVPKVPLPTPPKAEPQADPMLPKPVPDPSNEEPQKNQQSSTRRPVNVLRR